MRLIVARCSAIYSGRLDTVLPEALRLIMVKSGGSVLLIAGRRVKALNKVTDCTNAVSTIQAPSHDPNGGP